ncbi:MAG: DNA polymerase III subunit beta [Methylicorpusculum sp.]|uniref:DNA polymerase III subunit beta n=1 Tax=Methylicorpusculum sp. TaxID=2713644 RepID=UPI00272F44DA|nr:DNA polymerase III subunit beta [Methylicorpusculum sp.]MDP2204278.1 DNA polymerase III subunit beta [Methylicorpusculum sp.]
MKFSVNREQIVGPLQQIARIIDKRQACTILSNVLLQCRDSKLVITATDLEVKIVIQLNLNDIRVEGNITLDARKVLDICRLLPTGSDIHFDLEGDKINLSSGSCIYLLNTLPADDFPEFTHTEAETCFNVKAEKLKDGLDKTAFCMAINSERNYLNGIEMTINDSMLKLVASDGNRLAVYKEDIGSTGLNANIIVPKKAVQELSCLLDGLEEDVEIRVSRNTLEALYKNVVFSSKLVADKFPNFDRIVNQLFLNPIIVDRGLLKDSIKRVEVLSNEKYKGVSFDIKSASLKISTDNPEADEAEEDLVVDYHGDPVSIAFNAKYMLDAVNNIDGKDVKMTVAENASVCFIEGQSDSLFWYLVMPMRI